jgi:glycosyltransferase involved in cell wall biosynthesis
MRVLFLTNFYLVHGAGGQEQSCQQVVEGLRQRGHTALVLTSMHGTNNQAVEADGIYRSLYLEMDLVPLRHSITFFTRRRAREEHDLRVLDRVLNHFDPDIIFIWGMWNLPNSLPALAEARYPHKVVYRFATYWPTLPSQHEFYWRTPGRTWYGRIPKQVLGRVALAMLARDSKKHPLRFEHAICVSRATRDNLVEAGIPVASARVIHTGLDASPYLETRHRQGDGSHGLRLLCAGRLAPDKGFDTAIKAIGEIVFGRGRRDIELSVAGSGSTDYGRYLRELVDQERLKDFVSFLGWVPPEEMPELLRRFEVLLVPSVWPEPFSRIVLEGMASGLVVVATPTGGTTEILDDGENGLLFAAGDAEDLAQKILRLATDSGQRRRLALAGQKLVAERFTLPKMMDEIESYLQEVLQSSPDEQSVSLERGQ